MVLQVVAGHYLQMVCRLLAPERKNRPKMVKRSGKPRNCHRTIGINSVSLLTGVLILQSKSLLSNSSIYDLMWQDYEAGKGNLD